MTMQKPQNVKSASFVLTIPDQEIKTKKKKGPKVTRIVPMDCKLSLKIQHFVRNLLFSFADKCPDTWNWILVSDRTDNNFPISSYRSHLILPFIHSFIHIDPIRMVGRSSDSHCCCSNWFCGLLEFVNKFSFVISNAPCDDWKKKKKNYAKKEIKNFENLLT
jgi:hypothetical protein